MSLIQGIANESTKRQFEDEGYITVDTGIPESILDQAIRDFQGFWTGKMPWGVTYADAGRVQDGWVVSKACFKIATFPNVLKILQRLYDREPRPFQTLNFAVGTEQKAHSDAVHFNCEPFGLMCGVWVALEDVGPDQGPLVYYPGSHKLPETNYQDIGAEPDPKNYYRYEDYIEGQIEKYRLKPRYGLVKKGQAIVWAANLLHGGSARQDKIKTRHSQVTHYYFEGAKPWRPVHSKTKRFYFNPDWIIAQRRQRKLRKNQLRHFIHKIRGVFQVT